MRKTSLTITVLLLIVSLGCGQGASTRRRCEGITLVWPTQKKSLLFMKVGPDIKTTKSPNGFKISPAEVFDKCSPCKYLVTIYADNEFYYLVKNGGDSKRAKQFGIKVNGKTGEVIFPKVANRYTPLHYGGVSNRNTPTPLP